MRVINTNIYSTSQFTAFAVMLAACAGEPQRLSTLDSIDAALVADTSVSGTARSDTPGNIASALLPEIKLDIPGSSGIDVEPRFDMKVNRANVRQFFMGLVADTPHNMVLHPKVKGRITLDLKNVTVMDVMNVARDVYGYDFEKTATGFQVFPNTMGTRIFKLNYLNVQRKGNSQMRVSSGQVTDKISGGDSTNNSTNRAASAAGLSGSSIDTNSESNFWSELDASVRAMVGNKEGRSVVTSPQSGIIVVRAMPYELRAVEKYIQTTQSIMQRQVIIEAKIIEVELSEQFQAGINWSALATSTSNSYQASQTGGGTIFGSDGTSGIAGNSGDLNPGGLSQIVGSTAEAFGGIFSLALNISDDFAAFIELLETQGDVQVLSSPKVSTINNQKAVIKVGQDEFFITDVDSSTDVASGTSSTQSNVELTPFFTGVALDVIPQISEEGNIILHIHPSVSSVVEKVKNISTSTTNTLSVPLAVSTIRESDSIIRAQSGQVVVIGGLMQDSISDEDASVPLLGDLPLIGGLFRQTREVKKKSELVILLKPIIVENGDTWKQAVRSTRQRIKQLRGN